MAVPRFYGRWLKNVNSTILDIIRKILQAQLPSEIYSLSFDLNSLIHMAASKVYGYGDDERQNQERQDYFRKNGYTVDSPQLIKELKEMVTNLLMNAINLTDKNNTLKLLIIAVDGVAPQAKITQQRQRRYKAAFDRENSTEREKPYLVFNNSVITPGTKFMMELDEYLADWIRQNQANFLKLLSIAAISQK